MNRKNGIKPGANISGSQQSDYRQPRKPGLTQPKMASGAVTRKPPVAPPVYRPGQKRVAQPKMVSAAQGRTPPKAPPVYRPQAKPVGVQAKMASTSQMKNHPVAPPVYHPQPVPKVLQTKKTVTHHGQQAYKPVAPPVPGMGQPARSSVQAKSASGIPIQKPARHGQQLPGTESAHVVQQRAGQVKNPLGPGVAVARDRAMEAKAARLKISAARNSVQPKRATAVLQLSGRKSVIQMAGTKPRVFSRNPANKYLVKLTSAREEFIYQHRQSLGLSLVTAEYHDVVDVEKTKVSGGLFGSDTEIISRVWIHNEQGGMDPIDLPVEPGAGLQVPKEGQKILVIDTIGWKDGGRNEKEKKRTFVMDIKIGTHTKSGEQFLLEGANLASRIWKTFEHDFKDAVQRGSRDVGFDICDGRDKFEAALSNARSGKRKNEFKTALRAIIYDIRSIRFAVKQGIRSDLGAVYVGASVFCFFDLNEPDRSSAKLIDPDHPILIGSRLNALDHVKPRDVMNKAAFEGQETGRDWGEYRDKWKASFLNGLKLLITYFENALALADQPHAPQLHMHGAHGGGWVRY